MPTGGSITEPARPAAWAPRRRPAGTHRAALGGRLCRRTVSPHHRGQAPRERLRASGRCLATYTTPPLCRGVSRRSARGASELRVRASGCYLAVGAVTSGSAALPGSLSSAAVIGFGRVGRMGGCDGLRRPVLGCAASVDGSPRADSPRDGRADRPPLPWCAAGVAARSSPDASLPFASNVPAARLAKVVVLAR